MSQFRFITENDRLVRLSAMGDPLEKIVASVDFKIFRPKLHGVSQLSVGYKDTPIGKDKHDILLKRERH